MARLQIKEFRSTTKWPSISNLTNDSHWTHLNHIEKPSLHVRWDVLEVVRETWGKGLAGKAPSVVQRFFVGKAANTWLGLHVRCQIRRTKWRAGQVVFSKIMQHNTYLLPGQFTHPAGFIQVAKTCQNCFQHDLQNKEFWWFWCHVQELFITSHFFQPHAALVHFSTLFSCFFDWWMWRKSNNEQAAEVSCFAWSGRCRGVASGGVLPYTEHQGFIDVVLGSQDVSQLAVVGQTWRRCLFEGSSFAGSAL